MFPYFLREKEKDITVFHNVSAILVWISQVQKKIQRNTPASSSSGTEPRACFNLGRQATFPGL